MADENAQASEAHEGQSQVHTMTLRANLAWWFTPVLWLCLPLLAITQILHRGATDRILSVLVTHGLRMNVVATPDEDEQESQDDQ